MISTSLRFFYPFDKKNDVNFGMSWSSPMQSRYQAETSTSFTDKLNNDAINAFNAKMQEICQQNRWYYLNVAEKFKDENGFLILDYCSDKTSMGNPNGAKELLKKVDEDKK